MTLVSASCALINQEDTTMNYKSFDATNPDTWGNHYLLMRNTAALYPNYNLFRDMVPEVLVNAGYDIYLFDDWMFQQAWDEHQQQQQSVVN